MFGENPFDVNLSKIILSQYTAKIQDTCCDKINAGDLSGENFCSAEDGL